LREVYDASLAFLWAVAHDSKGNIYAGGGSLGGSRAKLSVIDSQGRGKLLAELDGITVQAIAIDRQDRVYAATSPDGKVYRVDASGRELDMTRMYSTFFYEIAIYFLPYMLGAMSLMLVIGLSFVTSGSFAGPGMGIAVAGVGLGMTLKGFYRFGPLGEPAHITVYDLMADPYASPLRGKPVRVSGTVIGRADAGNRIGEDFVLEDQGGGLTPINYESPLGFLGNWWFAWRRVGKLVQQRVECTGWFRRGITHQVDLSSMQTGSGPVSSYTAFWGKAGGVIVLLAGLGFAVVAFFGS